MKILSFMNPVSFGGGERLMLDFGDYFTSQHIDFLVVNLNRSAPFEEKLAAHGLRSVNIGNVQFRQTPRKSEYVMLFFKLIGRIPAIRRTIAREAPDHVLANGFPTIVLVATALAFFGKKPKMIYVHHFMKAKENPLVAAVYAFFLNRYDTIVAVSSRTRDTLVEQFPGLRSKITFVSNGIECRRFAVAEDKATLRKKLGLPDGIIAMCVGRLTAFKNQRLLIDIAKSVGRKDFYTVIVGDGDEHESLSREIKERGLGDRVRLLGSIDSETLPLYLHAADLFPYPSLKEGFGIVIAEAMAAGLPTVILENIYIPEFGDAVMVAKDEAEFGRMTKQLVDDDRLRQSLGKKARAYAAEHLDISVTGKKFLETIR